MMPSTMMQPGLRNPNALTRSCGPSLLLLVCVAMPSLGHAGGFSVTTFGSRRTGMLANMAATDEITALYHNPAALADQKGLRLHLSNSFAFLDTGFDLQALDNERFPAMACVDGEPCDWPVGVDGYYQKEIKPLSTFGMLPYVGISQSLELVSDSLRDVVISAAVTAPNFYAGALPEGAPSSYHFIDGHFLVLSSMFGVGWRINDQLSVGGTAMYNYMRLKYAQRFSMASLLRGRDGSGDAFTADLAQFVVGDLRLNFFGEDHGIGWTLSTLYTPYSWLSLGLSYNDATDPRLRGEVTVSPVRADVTQEQLDDAVEGFGYQLPSGLTVEMPLPPFISFGANVRASAMFEVGADCRLWLYNVYNEQAIIPVYSQTDGKQPLTREQLSQKKNYSVSYDVSLGGLARPVSSLVALEFLAGVGFDKSPVPDEHFTIDNPSMDNYRFALGLRWYPPQGLRVALTYVYIGYLGRDVTTSETSPPLNARGRGNNHAPRLELEYAF